MKLVKKTIYLLLLICLFMNCVPYKKRNNTMLWFIPLALIGQGSSPTYTVGGSTSGIEDGKYITLKTSSESILNIVSNGSFIFNSSFDNNAEYSVSIAKQPSGQTCSLTNETGTISGANIADIAVSCSSNTVIPTQTALSVSFSDIDPQLGKVGGTVSITKASDESNITSYSLYWANSSGEKISSSAIATIATTGSDLSYGITTGTDIPSGASHFLVLSGNSAGEMESGVTSSINDRIDSIAPTTGTFSSADTSTTTLVLNWDRATDDATAQADLKYIVYQSSSANLDTAANAETNGSALNSLTADLNTYTVIGLSPNSTYYFNVLVVDELGNKSSHTMLSASTLNNDAPVAGNGGSITTSNVTTTSVNLTWNDGSDNLTNSANLEYRVYQSVANNIGSVANAEANGTALNAYTQGLTAYNVTGLLNSATYYFTVILQDTDGNKSVYQTATVQTLDGTAPIPGASGTISATGIAGTSLTLHWSKANDDMTSQSNLQYLVYQSTSNNITTVTNAEANGTPLNSYTSDIGSLAVSSLNSSSTYYFNVLVKDSVGNKSIYSIGNFSTIDSIAPVPGNSGAIATSSTPSNSSITLAWAKASDGISSQNTLQYIVYRSTSNNIATVTDAEVNGTAINSYTTDIATATDTGLSSGTTYYYTVLVKDEAGNKAAYTMSSFGTEIFSWQFVDGDQVESGINRDSAEQVVSVAMEVFNSKLYHCMVEAGKVRVTVYNGDDTSPTWTSVDAAGLNHNAAHTASGCNIIAFNSKLYAIWLETNSSAKTQVRAAVYNGNDSSPAWTFVDGNASDIGLNKINTENAFFSNDGNSYANDVAHAVVYNSQLYIAWLEHIAGYGANHHKTHVAVYNSNDASPAWSFVDGAKGYVNTNWDSNTRIGGMYVFNAKLYLSLSEKPGSPYIRIYRYNDDPNVDWNTVVAFSNHFSTNAGLNHLFSYPLFEFNSKLHILASHQW
ncbi:MAG: hypothetical protein AAF518_25060, partial [Spirochaetota bacterium]